jgi:hypothetical protein
VRWSRLMLKNANRILYSSPKQNKIPYLDTSASMRKNDFFSSRQAQDQTFENF